MLGKKSENYLDSKLVNITRTSEKLTRCLNISVFPIIAAYKIIPLSWYVYYYWGRLYVI